MNNQIDTAVGSFNVLDMVLTTKEASETYDVADCTFRTWINEGLFKKEDIKKSGSTWLIKREAVESLLKSKNMFGKNFMIDGEEVHVEYLAYKGNKIQIWYENNTVKEILENMPNNELIHQMFEVFKEESKMNFKSVIIDTNLVENDNWYFRKEKVWALTLRGVMETVLESMVRKNVDTKKLVAYMNSVLPVKENVTV